jgi:hypothetical protein
MLFSNPFAGEQHGYFDGWHEEDGLFHYSGEGQTGDQEMQRGNKAIRDHTTDGRELHLFIGEKKGAPVEYQGEFRYVSDYQDEAPETSNGPLRKVIVFRLEQVGNTAGKSLPASELERPTETRVELVAPEEHNTELYYLEREHPPTSAEKREAVLVKQYRQWAASLGRKAVRHRISVQDELKPLFSDLFDEEANMLIEAKGTVTREAMRMAIGQLYDYRRFIEGNPSLYVLVPERPRADLEALATTCRVGIIFKSDDDFVIVNP